VGIFLNDVNLLYDVDLLVGIFLNDVNLLVGPCLFHSGFPHEMVNTPHQDLFNFSCLLGSKPITKS
jgi:hypothetical protein